MATVSLHSFYPLQVMQPKLEGDKYLLNELGNVI